MKKLNSKIQENEEGKKVSAESADSADTERIRLLF